MFLTNEQNEQNDKRICEIIENYWGLSKDSTKKFKEEIFKKDYPIEYSKFNLDKNGRAFIKLENDYLEKIDDGWKSFKEIFSFFPKEIIEKITYKNFRENLIAVDKQNIKIFKYLVESITKHILSLEKNSFERKMIVDKFNCTDNKNLESSIRNYIEYYLENIAAKKIPKNDIYFVISCNFTDWFLCSTGESWRSCLNLEKENGFWGGLPSLILDKNRAMAFITTGDIKKCYGLTALKMISRSWILTSKKIKGIDQYAFIMEYPDKGSSFLEKVSEYYLNISYIDIEEFKNNYDVELLYSTHSKCEFYTTIYIDRLSFYIKKGKIFEYSSKEKRNRVDSYSRCFIKNKAYYDFDEYSFITSQNLSEVIIENKKVFLQQNE